MSEANIDYQPGAVPDTPEALIQYLSDELYRISAKLADLEVTAFPTWEMYGATSNFTLDTTRKTLTNYPQTNAWNGGLLADLDPAAGTITVSTTGLYTITGWAAGFQGNNSFAEQMALFLEVNGTPEIMGVMDIATNKTDGRTVIGVITRTIPAGTVLSLGLEATAGLGTFNFVNTTFEVRGQVLIE